MLLVRICAATLCAESSLQIAKKLWNVITLLYAHSKVVYRQPHFVLSCIFSRERVRVF